LRFWPQPEKLKGNSPLWRCNTTNYILFFTVTKACFPHFSSKSSSLHKYLVRNQDKQPQRKSSFKSNNFVVIYLKKTNDDHFYLSNDSPSNTSHFSPIPPSGTMLALPNTITIPPPSDHASKINSLPNMHAHCPPPGPTPPPPLPFRVRNLGIVTIRRTFEMRCANTRTTQE
jgi:hypothetical protein